MKAIYKIGEAPCKSCELNDALDSLDDYPEADVAPVIHAHWVEKWEGTYPKRTMYCSYCIQKSGIGGIEKNQRKPYCPNCGAKMDEEEER